MNNMDKMDTQHGNTQGLNYGTHQGINKTHLELMNIIVTREKLGQWGEHGEKLSNEKHMEEENTRHGTQDSPWT